MSDSRQHINEILNHAANDLRVPTEVANLFLRVGAELLQQQTKIESLQETMNNQYERFANQINMLRKEVERLKGTHGA